FLLLGSAFDLSHPELLWVGGIGLVTVVIALYYYLCVTKRIYVFEPRNAAPIVVPPRMRATLMVSMGVLIAAGVAPGLLERAASRTHRQRTLLPKRRPLLLRGSPVVALQGIEKRLLRDAGGDPAVLVLARGVGDPLGQSAVSLERLEPRRDERPLAGVVVPVE